MLVTARRVPLPLALLIAHPHIYALAPPPQAERAKHQYAWFQVAASAATFFCLLPAIVVNKMKRRPCESPADARAWAPAFHQRPRSPVFYCRNRDHKFTGACAPAGGELNFLGRSTTPAATKTATKAQLQSILHIRASNRRVSHPVTPPFPGAWPLAQSSRGM